MAMLHLTDDELWKKVEEDRLREQRLREPYLTAFRALPQEIALRGQEDTQEAALGYTAIGRFGEGIARSAREMVDSTAIWCAKASIRRFPKTVRLERNPAIS